MCLACHLHLACPFVLLLCHTSISDEGFTMSGVLSPVWFSACQRLPSCVLRCGRNTERPYLLYL